MTATVIFGVGALVGGGAVLLTLVVVQVISELTGGDR